MAEWIDTSAPTQGEWIDTSEDEPEVLNEQGVTNAERGLINNVGLGPASIVQRLKDFGYEARDLGGDDYAVRKPGDAAWKKVDPSGMGDWWKDLTLDAGDEIASGITTTAGALGGGILGAAGAAAGTEAVRRGLGAAAGFKETPGEFLGGVGEQALYGGVAELGGRAVGKLATGARNLLRGPAVEAAEVAAKTAPDAAPGLLKPLAAEAIEGGEAAAVKPEVQAFKEAMGGKVSAEAGGEVAESAPGLLKTPEELDAILKPEARAGVRMQPGAAETPPGLEPGWTAGHKAGGETARGIQEVGRSTPSRVFEGNYGPVTLVQGSRDQAKRLLEEAGDEGASILYVKNPDPKALRADPGASSELRYFHNARPIAKGPEAFPGEGATSFAENLKGWSDEDVLKLLHKRGAKIKGKMQPDFYGTTDIDRLSREQMEDLLFRTQKNVVQGPRALKRNKKTGEVGYGAKKAKTGEDFDYAGNKTGHGLEGIWEQIGDKLDDGHYRDIHFDKILEMRIGKKVYRFSEEGKPVLAGTTDEIPLPTEAMIAPTPGAAPQVVKMAPKHAEKVAKLTAPAAATPQELAARGILPPGPIGKVADMAEGLLAIPKNLAGGIGKLTGLGPKASKGLLMGADFLSTGGVGTGTRLAAGAAVKGAKLIDRLLQPGGLTRAIQSAPDAVRPALEGILHQLETKGEAAGKAALYVAIRSAGGAAMREWLDQDENEKTPPVEGGASRSF